MTRRGEIQAGLSAVRDRIERACAEAGRDPAEVTLVVVTKLFPADDVRLLAELGVRHIGENRHQEAVAKATVCADLDLTWHFVGGLQTNKAAAVTAYAHVVQSVDRPKLATMLDRGARQHGRTLDVLVQVGLDPPEAAVGRSGAAPAEVHELAEHIQGLPGLRLRGLMAVAPLGEDPAAAFARLAVIRAGLLVAHPAAGWLSAGMSGDLEAGVRAGATHVRVGSAVLGRRPGIK